MAKMKMLQPEMEKLRERYKDDRAKQQQELMTLYRDRKINPMAGCLPVVVQIPVFFALYKVLFITIDMRQAPFFGWIKDLSVPDPTSVFNLFGLLPYAVPEFLHIGAWPLVMGITMWVQMQLNPQQPDPMQQKIFNWMPVMFTFLLANFAVGLVIYWAWNNVLSVLQQYTIMRKNGAEIHLWKNMGVDRLITRLRSGQGLGAGDAVAKGSAALRRGAEKLGQRLSDLKQLAAPGQSPGECAPIRGQKCRGAGANWCESRLRSERRHDPRAGPQDLGARARRHRDRDRRCLHPPGPQERQPERLGEAEPGARGSARQGGCLRRARSSRPAHARRQLHD